MGIKFNRNLQLGYGISILMLVLVAVISYQTVERLLDSNRAVTHSAHIVQKLEKALSLMTNAETGQRGYLLTGKPQFLEPYKGSPQQAIQIIDEVKALTRDNPRQQQYLGEIRQIMATRLNILQQIIEKKQAARFIPETDLEAGKQAMDALRKAVDKAEGHEQALLNERNEVLARYSAVTPAVILGAIVLSLLIAGYSYMRVIRDVRENERLHNELESKEHETAAMNEELSAANEEITAANEEITAANEELMAINEELVEAREELATTNESLEQRVAERTRELAETEEETQALNEELMASNEELMATNEELISTRRAVERNAALFVTIAQNIPGSALLLLDKDQHLLAAEGNLVAGLGYGGDGIIGKHIRDVHPERYSVGGPLYDRMLGGEQFRNDRRGFDGRDYRVDFVPLRDEDGIVYAGLVICLDITERKQAEEHSAKLAAIVESSDDAIISKGLDGIVTSWNKGARRMFGHTEADMVGSSILKLIPEDRQDEEPLIIGRLKKGERVEHFETRRVTAEGRQIDVSLTISPIFDGNGAVIGVSKIARDISEQKRDEQRKNDFIAMASHELKTPLTSITALVQLLHKKLQSSEDSFVPSALSKADMQVRKMAAMVNGFLNVSRLESGKLHIVAHEFDLNQLITDIIDETRLTVATHTLVFEPCETTNITADRDKIGSVISNLISNAIKYSPRGKLVTIVCRSTPQHAEVSVSDEGMGIKADDMGKLFDRYYRVSNTHTQHISGFGIGLYLSAEIIRHHGGNIWAESEKGVGSTFHFTLPVGEGMVSE
jgi:PAS domain S-box-containing protein